MKQSEFKYRLNLLWAFVKFTFAKETAYAGNNWGNIFSTVFYTISMILFIDVTYANVDMVAGYSRDQMLLFMFMGQISYYTYWSIYRNLRTLGEDVNTGNLDILLTKPVPSLFYVTFRRISIYNVIRDGIPAMGVLWCVINWENLSFSSVQMLYGLIVVLLGMICVHVMHFMFTIPVFWLGESANLRRLAEGVEYNLGKTIPFEGYSPKMRVLLSTVLPILITAGVSTSVVLGKSEPVWMIVFTGITAIVLLIVMNKMWSVALRAYSSASS